MFLLNFPGILFILIPLFIILLLIVPVKFTLSKNPSEDIKIILRVLFIPIKLTLKKKDKKDKKDKKKKTEKAPPQKPARPLSFREKVTLYISVITKALKELKHILYHVRVSDLSLNIILSEGNAAFTAIATGGINAVLYPMLGIIECNARVDKGAFKINVAPDYNEAKSSFGVTFSIHLALIHLLMGGLKFYSHYKKQIANMQS